MRCTACAALLTGCCFMVASVAACGGNDEGDRCSEASCDPSKTGRTVADADGVDRVTSRSGTVDASEDGGVDRVTSRSGTVDASEDGASNGGRPETTADVASPRSGAGGGTGGSYFGGSSGGTGVGSGGTLDAGDPADSSVFDRVAHIANASAPCASCHAGGTGGAAGQGAGADGAVAGGHPSIDAWILDVGSALHDAPSSDSERAPDGDDGDAFDGEAGADSGERVDP